MNNNKKTVWLVIIVAVVVIGGFFISTYNSLATSRTKVESQWSQVENTMQRRYDLVPNLVNAVKGSMKQEQKVFGDIAEARKAYANAGTDAEKMQADAELNQSVGTLVNAIREDYPQLDSNKNVQDLMVQLEGSENRIAQERRTYIKEVEGYNRSIVRFPKNMVAKMLGFEKIDYYKADEKAQTAPSVDFGFDE